MWFDVLGDLDVETYWEVLTDLANAGLTPVCNGPSRCVRRHDDDEYPQDEFILIAGVVED